MHKWQAGRMVEIAAAVALTAAALVFVVARAEAAEGAAERLEIADAWARPSIGATANSAAYATVRNAGERADALVSAASPVARAVELHTHVRDGDIMRMRPVEGDVEVPAGGSVTLEPGGLHVMLIGLTRRLEEGDSFPLTLSFERAGEMTVEVEVRSAAPDGSHEAHDPHHGHGH